MKRVILAFLILISPIALIPVLTSGCGTTPYKAVATTQVSVQAAMHLWGAYVAANHPPVTQEAAVKAAYEKWQSAMAIVCDAGRTYAASQAANANNQSVLLAALEQAIGDLTTDKNDLLDLLTKFGVKIV